MYSTSSGLVFGFHGCDKSVALDVLSQKEQLKQSTNEYDWLGHGIYFWQNSYSRALDYAKMLKANPHRSTGQSIKEPFVLGAILNLGYCFDLLDYENLTLLKDGYEFLMEINYASNVDMPINKQSETSMDLLRRNLDCAVLNTIHEIRVSFTDQQPFDSVRGVFFEGEELYPNAGFREKDHIQICIRNPNCIKGYFLPRELNDQFNKV